MVVILFLIMLFFVAMLVFPAAKGVRDLHNIVNKDEKVTLSLLRAMGYSFFYIIFQSVFWIFFFTARFYIPEEIIRSTPYAVALLIISSLGTLIPAITINRWWSEFCKLIDTSEQKEV